MENIKQDFEFDFAKGEIKTATDSDIFENNGFQAKTDRNLRPYVIKTENLTKFYKNKAAVDSVNVSVRQGDIYGLIGKNGAGKTTLFKIILGLAKPDNGTIELFNDATSIAESRKKIGYLIEYPSFSAKLTAFENLKYMALQKGCYDEKQIIELIDLVGLGNESHKKFSAYSLGMKQRLGLAFALLGSPELLILDEPVNGLDPEAIQAVRNLILKLNREKNLTIVISSHLISELSKVADCYGVMANGKLVKEIDETELNEIVKPFIKLVVDDQTKTIDVLKSMGIENVKLANNGTVYCYDLVNRLSEISKKLAENGIVIFSISANEGDIENYFISLLGGNRQ